MQSFISPYSNIFYTLLNSLDEKIPLLIIPINKLLKNNDTSKLNIKTIDSIDLNFIISYYKDLPDLCINIGSQLINTTQWNNKYCNILNTERIDIHKPYIDSLNKYYDKLISAYQTEHPQSPLSKCGYTNINKHNIHKKLTKNYKIYKKLTKYKHKK